jgi:hypothetical protein
VDQGVAARRVGSAPSPAETPCQSGFGQLRLFCFAPIEVIQPELWCHQKADISKFGYDRNLRNLHQSWSVGIHRRGEFRRNVTVAALFLGFEAAL